MERESDKKLYFSISEVAEKTGLPPHTIRYWEQVFPALRPLRDRGGRRRYREEDIRLIQRIKELVHGERYSLKGAAQRMAEIDRGEERKLRNIYQLRSVISEIETHANNIAAILNIK